MAGTKRERVIITTFLNNLVELAIDFLFLQPIILLKWKKLPLIPQDINLKY